MEAMDLLPKFQFDLGEESGGTVIRFNAVHGQAAAMSSAILWREETVACPTDRHHPIISPLCDCGWAVRIKGLFKDTWKFFVRSL